MICTPQGWDMGLGQDQALGGEAGGCVGARAALCCTAQQLTNRSHFAHSGS